MVHHHPIYFQMRLVLREEDKMETLYQILGLIAAALIVWVLYRSIKSQPEQFNRENLTKSFMSMGILALLLIAFVALLVFMIRNT